MDIKANPENVELIKTDCGIVIIQSDKLSIAVSDDLFEQIANHPRIMEIKEKQNVQS